METCLQTRATRWGWAASCAVLAKSVALTSFFACRMWILNLLPKVSECLNGGVNMCPFQPLEDSGLCTVCYLLRVWRSGRQHSSKVKEPDLRVQPPRFNSRLLYLLAVALETSLALSVPLLKIIFNDK